MTKAQLDRIKLGTQSKGAYGPWKDHEDEMQRKTVVRRIAKYLPLTPELADAFALEDEADRLDASAPDVPTATGVDALASVVKAKQATVEAQSEWGEPPHDPQIGEVREDGAPDEEEQEEIRRREAEEAAGNQ